MPYVTPIGESPTSGGSPPTETHYVDESDLLSSVIKAYGGTDSADDGPGEATVRLDARPLPDNKITIDTQLSDRTVARTEDDRNRIVHHALGHVSHNKMAATSAVVDGMPKYSKFDTWCTCCQKGKMHMLPHAHNLWNERATHKNAVWHIDLIGKFRSPSLGGNYLHCHYYRQL